MKIIYLLIISIAITLQRQPQPKQEKSLLITDYLPSTEAFDRISQIQTQYKDFREKVKKNMTIDYEKCITSIKTLQCNNLDQWQSVIEELKLENENSANVEIPFLQQRKLIKQQRLKQLLDISDVYDARMLEIVGQLDLDRQAVVMTSKEIEMMYKLPKHAEQTEFSEKKQVVNVPASLNTNVPDVAGTELQNTQNQYDLADQSIQAQTVMNEMVSATKKIAESIVDVQKSFEEKQKELHDEKQQLKEDITRLRALITNEQGIQGKNVEKIALLEEKILACENQPTNIQKDCEPIRIRAAKLDTEIQIMDARTNLLHSQIEFLMKMNQSPEIIKEYYQNVTDGANAAAARAADMYYVDQLPDYIPPEDPKERKPIHHLKEGIQMHEGQQQAQQ